MASLVSASLWLATKCTLFPNSAATTYQSGLSLAATVIHASLRTMTICMQWVQMKTVNLALTIQSGLKTHLFWSRTCLSVTLATLHAEAIKVSCVQRTVKPTHGVKASMVRWGKRLCKTNSNRAKFKFRESPVSPKSTVAVSIRSYSMCRDESMSAVPIKKDS